MDAYSIYVVETCLLVKLPEIFTPSLVYELSDELITQIAAESPASTAERINVNKKLKVLERTMTTLQRLRTINISGTAIDPESQAIN